MPCRKATIPTFSATVPVIRNPMRTGADVCARTVVAHSPPAKKPRISRRLIAPPRTRQSIVSVQTGLVKYGAMSALGQKQTYAVQQVMSALPPIATAKADKRQAAHDGMLVQFDILSNHVPHAPASVDNLSRWRL